MVMEVGEDSVIIGNVGNLQKVGNGCVIIGATDANGNCILNTTMAIGRNAYAGENSIAIGANAGAGIQFNLLLDQLKLEIKNQEIKNLIEEMKTSQDKSGLWAKIKSTINMVEIGMKGAALINKITTFIHKF